MQNKLNPFWRFFLILYSFLFLNALSLSLTLSLSHQQHSGIPTTQHAFVNLTIYQQITYVFFCFYFYSFLRF